MLYPPGGTAHSPPLYNKEAGGFWGVQPPIMSAKSDKYAKRIKSERQDRLVSDEAYYHKVNPKYVSPVREKKEPIPKEEDIQEEDEFLPDVEEEFSPRQKSELISYERYKFTKEDLKHLFGKT